MGIEMFPVPLTRVCSERSGAPYTAISSSSPGPINNAELGIGEAFESGGFSDVSTAIFGDSLGDWIVIPFGSVLFCADPMTSQHTRMLRVTVEFSRKEREFERRRITA
jgi:hypothetical protein